MGASEKREGMERRGGYPLGLSPHPLELQIEGEGRQHESWNRYDGPWWQPLAKADMGAFIPLQNP